MGKLNSKVQTGGSKPAPKKPAKKAAKKGK